MSSQTYAVTGMTCGHCASAVTEAVAALDGVTEVAVDVARGTVSIDARSAVSSESVAGAVADAGYTLVGSV